MGAIKGKNSIIFSILSGEYQFYNGRTRQTSCITLSENEKGKLVCDQDMLIESIEFASFGDPNESCGNLNFGRCHSPFSRNVIEEKCVCQQSCVVSSNEELYGDMDCYLGEKKLSVQYTCAHKF